MQSLKLYLLTLQFGMEYLFVDFVTYIVLEFICKMGFSRIFSKIKIKINKIKLNWVEHIVRTTDNR